MIVAGVSIFAFFKVGEIGLGSETAFAPIVTLWFALFALAPGFLLPIEQELTRLISDRRARGEGAGPAVKRVSNIALLLTVGVLGVIAISSPFITRAFFGGNWVMTVALAAGFAVYVPAHLARGICSGTQRFGSYAIIISTDGVVRIIGCLILAGLGVRTLEVYAFLVALAPLVPLVIVVGRRSLATDDGPPTRSGDISKSLGWLLAATVCSGALLNAGPLTAGVLATPDQADLITRFGRGVLLARAPLFLFQAVQASLLPKLTGMVSVGDWAGYRSQLRSVLSMVAGVAALGTVGAYLLGPWVLATVYGGKLPARTMALLALSSTIYMAAITLAHALIAVNKHARVALGWGSGIIAFATGIWLCGPDLLLRIEVSLVAAGSTALAVLALGLASAVRNVGNDDMPTLPPASTPPVSSVDA